MTTTPPTTTGTTAGEVLSEEQLSNLEEYLASISEHYKRVASRWAELKVRSVIASHRTLQRELAASREREARLVEALEKCTSIPSTILANSQIAKIAREALTETEDQ